MITLDQIRADRAALQGRWYREGLFTPRSFAEEMRTGAARFPNARMIFHSDEHPAEATLAEMHAQSLRLASALRALGLGPGDVVAIQVPNWLEGALVFQAAMLLGVVTLPIIHIYGPAEVGFVLRQSGARAFICPARWRQIDYLARLEQLDRSTLPKLEHVVVIGERAPAGALTWDALLARATPRFEPPRVSPDDVCMLVYTSGTTADPKGVQHTHNTLLAEVRGIRRTLDAGAPGTNLAAFPAGHIAGVLGLARLYLHGNSTILMDAWNADHAAELIERHRIAATAGTPFFLIGLLDAAERAKRDITCMTGYMVGAASVPPAVVERAERAGVRTYRAYGSSEHPTITSGAPDEPLAKRATTDGRLTPNNEIRIVDDDGADLPVGSAGEIVSRGPELFVGYRDERLDQDSFLPGGWFKTGDIGVLDAEGYLTITDRKKDIIIRGGENISSKEVEDVLARHPAVGEVAVVAAPDPRYGERVCAFVIPRAGMSLDLADVQKHFAAVGLARQKAPERLELVSELPRTASGKVKKFELRRGATVTRAEIAGTADELLGPVSRFFVSQRLRLHYVDWGNHGAPTLVLVHGGRDHARSWDWVARDLRRDWHVVAPDLRGHGDSAWAVGSLYHMVEYVIDLAQLLQAVGRFPVTLVAHSLGSSICANYAAVHPEHVARFVAIEGIEPPPRIRRWLEAMTPVERLRGAIEEAQQQAARAPRRYASLEAAAKRMLEENSFLSPDQARHLTEHGVSRNEDGTFSWKFDNYARGPKPFRPADDEQREIRRNVRCPALLIRGTESGVPDPAASGVLGDFANARAVAVEGAGHWVHHDRLAETLRLVRSFLAEP